jgi:adenine deaminase
MRLTGVTADDMRLHLPDLPDGTHRLRTIVGTPVTTWGETDVEVAGGVGTVPPHHILQVAVHRHGRALATPVAAVLAGWGDWTGAIATTVSHDTHNLIVFGVDADDMAVAANAVIATGGGIAVARDGEVLAQIDLPIAGILSPLPAAEVAELQRQVQEAALGIGLLEGGLTQPLLQCLAASLACLGGPHVTDVGLVDGTTGEMVPTMVVA